jgi:arylsulfatase A-like enzyme
MTTRFLSRTWVAFLALLVGAAVAPAVRAGETKRPAGKRPNFVFILIDDLGWADLGCYGSKFYETPNIDRLAARGVRFTQAYTANPVCSPTRASILTGQDPARLHLTNFLVGNRWPENSPLRPVDWAKEGISPEQYLLARALKAAGYATGIIGKWHLGKLQPFRFGFDEDAKVNLGGSPGGYFDEQGRYLTDRQTDAAERFLEKHKDRPFFLYLAYNAVHVPLQAKKDLVAKYEAKAHPPAGSVFGEDKGHKVRLVQNHPVYAAMIESMDQGVGRVLRKLQDLGLDENTVVIFFSDNGGLCSAEGWPTSNLPLRLGKGWLYEGGVRVPLLVRWPGVAKAGRVCQVPVISEDFYPTLLEMAGLPMRPHLDGRSLVPLLRGADKMDRQTLYWHYPHYSNQGGTPSGAVRHGDFKLIEFFEDGRLELYDLRSDPGERQDLAEKMPGRARELRGMLHAWRQAVGAQVPERKAAGRDGKPAPAKGGTKGAGWKSLFDGKTLAGWKKTNFGGEGEVAIKDGAVVLEQGNDMTGITYTRGDFPRLDYEVTLEGKKLAGSDFFCTTTFPVGEKYCSLVVGGWGGTVVGLSSIDFRDASENETGTFKEFKRDQWYRVRIRVSKERITAWIDDKEMVDLETKGKRISIRAECDLCRPFGIATWRTTGAVRDIRVRPLTDAEKKAAGAK